MYTRLAELGTGKEEKEKLFNDRRAKNQAKKWREM